MKLKIKNILPEKSYVDEKVIAKDRGVNLLVYYLTRYSNGKLRSERFQPAKALVPKNIFFSKTIVENMGLYQGDGQKSVNSKSYQATRFSNSEPDILSHFLQFLEYLGIDKSKLYFNLRVSENIKLNNKNLKEYWCKKLKIRSKNFFKIQWRKNKSKLSKVAPHGTLTVIYSNSSFRLVFDSLLNYTKISILKSPNLASHFLRGLVAADGNVYFKNTRREVNIASKHEKDRIYINYLFKRLGIKTNKDNRTKNKETVRITGYPNFKIVEKYGLCCLHPKKSLVFKKLVSSYKNKCRRKGTSLPIILNYLKKPLTANQISIKLNRDHTTIRNYLNILEKEGKIERIGRIEHEKQYGRIPEKWVKKHS
jgi:hypothetical protein